MTDRSVPVGDRDDPPAVRPGPQMAREALAEAAPVQDFGRQVVQLAKAAGWTYARVERGDNGYPHLLFLRDERVLAVWVTSVNLGWQVDQWRARLTKAGVETHVFNPRAGIELVEAVLGPGRGIDFDCGQPIYDGGPDSGRRGD